MFGFLNALADKIDSADLKETILVSLVITSIAIAVCFALINIRSCNQSSSQNEKLQIMEDAKLKALESAKDERLKVVTIQSREAIILACKTSCGDKGVREVPADGSCRCN